jgi:NMD protein affecting ribosome stability and mRNA decay
MKEIIHIETEMEQQMCNSCKKISPDYYELKVQLRYKYFKEEEIEDIKKETIEIIKNNFNNINKIEENDGGFDIYLRNKSSINKVSSLFNKKYLVEEKRSKKIVGRNFLESVDIWRYIILINIINLKKGDKISIKGENYYIKAFNHKDLVLRNLENGTKKVISYNIAKDYLQKLN